MVGGCFSIIDVNKFSCFRAVFKNEKISTVIHSKEVHMPIFSIHRCLNVSQLDFCRWTNSSWPIATCWSPTWTDWSVKRSRRLKKPLSRKCASDQEAPSLVPLLSSVASVDVKLSFSASFNCLLLRTALTFYQFWAVINPCLCAGCLNYPVSGQWSDMQGLLRLASMTSSCFCVVLFLSKPISLSGLSLTNQEYA